MPYTAFTSKKGQAITARLIVRRVRDLNKQAAAGQDELFPAWRYHAVFTDSPFELVISRPKGSTVTTCRRAGVRRRHQRPARSSSLRRFRRERRVADGRGHRAQPGPRGRRAG